MTLLEEILAKCSPDQLRPENRDDGAIAALVSKDRTTLVSKFIGKAEITHALGIMEGAVFLLKLRYAANQPIPANATDQQVAAQAMIDQAWSMVDNKELDAGTTQAQQAIDMFVGPLLTKDQGDKIKALARVDDPVSPQEVAKALEGYAP